MRRQPSSALVAVMTLKKHFQDDPSKFSKFNPDPKSATAFTAPKDAPVVFLRPEPAKGE